MSTPAQKNAKDNLTHAAEFTRIENTAIVYVLRGWFGSLLDPQRATEIVELSDDVWALTTLQEHFDSELNSDAATRTHDSLIVLAELGHRAKAAQDKLNAILGTDEDERINTLVDQTVADVIKKLNL